MVIPGDTYGHLLLLWMKYMLIIGHVHALRLTPPTLELYLHSWGMTTFVTVLFIMIGKQGSILMTLSRMVGGVVELPQPTTDDTEVRECSNNEEITIETIELYIQ